MQNCATQVSPIYKVSKILKLSDNIKLCNFLLVFDDVNNKLPPALANIFQMIANSHKYSTRSSVQYNVTIPSARTTVYGIKKYYLSVVPRLELFYKSFQRKITSHQKQKTMQTNFKKFFP